MRRGLAAALTVAGEAWVTMGGCTVCWRQGRMVPDKTPRGFEPIF